MLKISNRTIHALQETGNDQFLHDLIMMVTREDPFHAEAIGPSGVQAAVSLGLQRAELYGIQQRSALRLYVRLMMYLGSRFDQDPMLPWAAETLQDAQFGEAEAERMNVLRSKFLQYLEDVSGDEGDHMQRFAYRVHSDFEMLPSYSGPKRVAKYLSDAYPEKARYVGLDTIMQMVRQSGADCERAGLTPESSACLLSVLKLGFGSHMVGDPLFPWITTLFQPGERTADKDALFARLGRTFVTRVIVHIETQREVG